MAAGGHVFGIVLSYGAIELLAAMLAKADPAGEGTERRRRMVMAVQRGFCVMNCWNPLNLMTVVVSGAVPAAPMRALIPAAFVAALAMMAAGWAEDRWSARRAPADGAPGSRGGWARHIRLIALVLAVMAACEAASLAFGVGLAAAVTLAVPLASALWIGCQAWRPDAPAARAPDSRSAARAREPLGEEPVYHTVFTGGARQ